MKANNVGIIGTAVFTTLTMMAGDVFAGGKGGTTLIQDNSHTSTRTTKIGKQTNIKEQKIDARQNNSINPTTTSSSRSSGGAGGAGGEGGEGGTGIGKGGDSGGQKTNVGGNDLSERNKSQFLALGLGSLPSIVLPGNADVCVGEDGWNGTIGGFYAFTGGNIGYGQTSKEIRGVEDLPPKLVGLPFNEYNLEDWELLRKMREDGQISDDNWKLLDCMMRQAVTDMLNRELQIKIAKILAGGNTDVAQIQADMNVMLQQMQNEQEAFMIVIRHACGDLVKFNPITGDPVDETVPVAKKGGDHPELCHTYGKNKIKADFPEDPTQLPRSLGNWQKLKQGSGYGDTDKKTEEPQRRFPKNNETSLIFGPQESDGNRPYWVMTYG